jgi:hypothetical protein
MRQAILISSLFLAMVVAGCAATSREDIQVAYGDQLAKLEPGMSLEDFKAILPQAKPFQRTFVAGGEISVYRLEHMYKPDDDPALLQERYFRFVNGKLDRWGFSSTWGE